MLIGLNKFLLFINLWLYVVVEVIVKLYFLFLYYLVKILFKVNDIIVIIFV